MIFGESIPTELSAAEQGSVGTNSLQQWPLGAPGRKMVSCTIKNISQTRTAPGSPQGPLWALVLPWALSSHSGPSPSFPWAFLGPSLGLCAPGLFGPGPWVQGPQKPI